MTFELFLVCLCSFKKSLCVMSTSGVHHESVHPQCNVHEITTNISFRILHSSTGVSRLQPGSQVTEDLGFDSHRHKRNLWTWNAWQRHNLSLRSRGVKCTTQLICMHWPGVQLVAVRVGVGNRTKRTTAHNVDQTAISKKVEKIEPVIRREKKTQVRVPRY